MSTTRKKLPSIDDLG